MTDCTKLLTILFGDTYLKEMEEAKKNYLSAKVQEKEYIINIDLSGVEDLKIEYKNFCLHIKGNRNGKEVYRKYSFNNQIDPKNIKATYKNGVLDIVIPRVIEELKSIPIEL